MKKLASVVVILLVLTSVTLVGFGNYVEVEVRSDWTLWRIAKNFEMSVSQLMEINNLKDTTIYPGQKLKVAPYKKSVLVSWYGPDFHGNSMANGERYDMNDPTVVAHKLLPFGTKVKLTEIESGNSIIVEVQDRGPYHGERRFDLSRAAAKKLGMLSKGVSLCRVEIL